MRGFKGAVLAVALLATPLPALAASLGVDITSNGPSGFPFINPGFTIGWAANVTQDVRVTALGVWDEGSDGLRESHAVGLWNGTGTLIASTTVPAGLGADTTVGSALGLGQWLFEDIAPVTLTPGLYFMGSTSGPDEFRTTQGTIALNPALTNFDSGKFAAGSNLQFPSFDETEQTHSDFSLFGPDLLLEPVRVPAPASLALLGVGLLGFGARWARRRRG